MGRPRKYSDLYGAQRAYHQTEKGEDVLKKSQGSKKEKQRKKNWWRENRGKFKSDRRHYFIATYGSIEKALNLLTSRESLVITHIYGLDGNPSLSQSAIADLLGKSQQLVSKLKQSAENKLKPLEKTNNTKVIAQEIKELQS